MHFPISVLLICVIDKDNILISCLYQYYPTAAGISTNEFLSHFNHKNTLLTGCPVKRVHINVFIGAGFLKRVLAARLLLYLNISTQYAV